MPTPRSKLASSYALLVVYGVVLPLPRRLVSGGGLVEHDYAGVLAFLASALPSSDPARHEDALDGLQAGVSLPGTDYVLREYLLRSDEPIVVLCLSQTRARRGLVLDAESAPSPSPEQRARLGEYAAQHGLALRCTQLLLVAR